MLRTDESISRVASTTLAKVPAVGVMFWIIKILTTGMGEAASDFLGNTNLALAGVIGIGGFATAMWYQLRTPRYVAWVYWTTVAMVALFGTMVADGLHVALGLPYAASTALDALLLIVVFVTWYRSEGTLSIHSITTRRREVFYWLTVLATFSLGTAAGDLTAVSLNLGFFGSGLLFTAAIVVPAVGWWKFRLPPVVAFWSAYVLTRPLGASFADWLGKPHSNEGGIGWGDGTVTGLALVIIAGLVTYLALSRADEQSPHSALEQT